MNNQVERDNRTDLLIEQYKILVETLLQITSRRGQTNRFYISVLSGLLILLSLSAKEDIFGEAQHIFMLCIAVLGFLLCVLWYLNLRSYSQMITARYGVIHELESKLPFPSFQREWQLLGAGKDKKKYRSLSSIERRIALAMMTPFVMLIVYSLLKICNHGN
jgi:hypothetical protein